MLRVPSLRHRRLTRVAAAVFGAAVAVPAGCERPSEGDAPWNTSLTPKTHGTRFPIADGPHAVDCNRCHGEFDTFTAFSCMSEGCHGQAETDGHHGGLEGYAYEAWRCYDCHPSGNAEGGSPVGHDKYFPIDPASKHKGQACGSCHTNPATRKEASCGGATCHTEPATAASHGHVGGYAWTGDKCILCHADAQVNPIAEHKPFTIAVGAHHRKDCAKCHPGRRMDKPWAIEFRSLTCGNSGCHSRTETDNHHQGQAGYGSFDDPTSCLKAGCHPTGRKE